MAWIKVSEQMPEPGKPVLAFARCKRSKETFKVVLSRDERMEWWDAPGMHGGDLDYSFDQDEVVAWQELPEDPPF